MPGYRTFEISQPFRNPEADQERRLIDSLTEYAIFSLDIDGRITSWNSGARLTFGYDPDEVLGKYYSVIFTAEAAANGLPERELSRALATGKASCDGWHVRKNGSRLWCTDTVQTLRDASGIATGFTKIVHDTTERHLAQELLRESEERFRLLIEGITDYAIFSVDVDGTILSWNAGAQRLYGYCAADVIGGNVAMLYSAEAVACDVPNRERAEAAAQGRAADEDWHVRRNGDRFFAGGQLLRLEPDADARPRGYVKIAHDITERFRLDDIMKRRALFDDLTRLPNRASFCDALRRTIDGAWERPQQRFAVLFIDLDQFKIVNDSLGHGIADELLVYVSRVLEACVRPGDVVARFGGDEFSILLPELGNESQAVAVAERIHATLGGAIALGGVDVYTTASIGIAVGPGSYETPEDVLRDADTAMYEAKARGRARHVIFDATMRAKALRLLSLQADLRQALIREEFRVSYQPIVSLEGGLVRGFEALLRWEHPSRGTILPGDFIGAAEQLGLIVEIDLWVIERACRQLHLWKRSGNATELTMSVNVSSKLFVNDRFVDAVEAALRRYDLPSSALNVEITETSLMLNIDTASENVVRLGELGVALSIDDFGTGYSSLSYLTRFPFKTLKVDRSFVRDIAFDRRSGDIAQTIVTLAQNLGIEAVAEGVETAEQLAKLRSIGCSLGQGLWFSPAVTAAAAERYIGRSLPSVTISDRRVRIRS